MVRIGAGCEAPCDRAVTDQRSGDGITIRPHGAICNMLEMDYAPPCRLSRLLREA